MAETIKIGDKYTMDDGNVVWEILFITDQIVVGKIVANPHLPHWPMGMETTIVIDPYMKRVE